jgi:hypothetical protein
MNDLPAHPLTTLADVLEADAAARRIATLQVAAMTARV